MKLATRNDDGRTAEVLSAAEDWTHVRISKDGREQTCNWRVRDVTFTEDGAE